MTQPPNQKTPIADQVVEFGRKLLIPGGATAGGIGAFWSLFGSSTSDIPKAIASAGIGIALSYGAAMLKPFHLSTRRRAEHAGKVVDEVTERAFTTVTGFDKKYLLCQASECESLRSEGMAQRDGIFVPLLREMFVELQIDSSASLPGFATGISERPDSSILSKQTIWDCLTEAKKHKAYLQMAILAWGGYGKTTLLKHVAYRYGIGDIPRGAPRLVPVLLVLRKYRGLLSQAKPPSLPELINQQHIPSLPDAYRLQPVPPNWARDLLQKGQALVLLDGFDEIPKQERPAVAKWINEQMQRYGTSVFVLTSRPKAYKEQDFADRLVLSVPLWVQAFDDNQRRKFIYNWYLCQERLQTRRDTPEVKKVSIEAARDLIGQIEEQPELRDLAKNPLLLNMIATFHRLYPGAALPKRQVDLYGEICFLQLKSRPRDRRLQTILLEIDPQPVLEQVAFRMMERELKRIDGNVLLQEINQALVDQDEAVDAIEFLKDVVQISELIVQQEDEYEFSHLSFQEYLAASYISSRSDEREELLYKYLKKDWWKTTILLYAGKIKKPASLIRAAIRQGENDLAYACLQQTTKRVDDALKVELKKLKSIGNIPISASHSSSVQKMSLDTQVAFEELMHVAQEVQDVRYSALDNHLKNQQWEKADNETYRLMITEVGKEEGQLFSQEDLLNFPCEPLKKIDELWVKHSNGMFGLSVQKDMYLECAGTSNRKNSINAWKKFCDINSWQEGAREIRYIEGYLPERIVTTLIYSWPSLDGSEIEMAERSPKLFTTLISRLESCTVPVRS